MLQENNVHFCHNTVMARTFAELRGNRFSQKELAARSRIDKATYNRIEAGRIKPTLKEVDAIAVALGVERKTIMEIILDQGPLWEPKQKRQKSAGPAAKPHGNLISIDRPFVPIVPFPWIDLAARAEFFEKMKLWPPPDSAPIQRNPNRKKRQRISRKRRRPVS